MSKIVAVTACPTGVAHTIMAAEALKKVAQLEGHSIRVEQQSSAGTKDTLSAAEIAAADVVILATDIKVDEERFADKPVFAVSTSRTIRETSAVLGEALAAAGIKTGAPTTVPATAAAVATATAPATTAKSGTLVGITSCPTGVAHTFMAAKALENAARALGYAIKVETQGSVGAQNVLTPEEIAAADAVVIAADVGIDQSRFGGKRLYSTSTKEAISHGQDVIKAALAAPAPAAGALADQVTQLKSERSGQRIGPYKHLMTGVSYMLPFVVAGGLLTALSFAIGGIYVGEQTGTIGAAFMQIGGAAFSVFIGVLSAFIAYSIADRPGIAPGMIGGLLAQAIGAGFLGGIVSGFLAGYITLFLNKNINLGVNLNSLKPVLILPVLASLATGLLMIYVVGAPVAWLLAQLENFLTSIDTANAVLVGLVVGAMMAVDMGGPVNKAAYTVSVGLITSSIYGPMAAVMAAGMTPPLALGIASLIFRDRFDAQDRQAASSAIVLGLSFITEGAIPYATKDPLRVIPALIVGSATAGALSMAFGCGLVVSHGGVFVLPIPNAVINLPGYIVAIAAGTAVSIAALYFLKRPLGTEQVGDRAASSGVPAAA
jgi:PTS system fructose-specific IIC component